MNIYKCFMYEDFNIEFVTTTKIRTYTTVKQMYIESKVGFGEWLSINK